MERDQISAIPGWWLGAADEAVIPIADDIDLSEYLDYDAAEIEVLPGPAHGVFVRQGPAPELWAAMKENILWLYEKDKGNLKLREVQQVMETTYRFVASKKQYKDKFKLWGVRKNERRQQPAFRPTARRRRRSSTATANTEVTELTIDSDTTATDSLVVVPVAASSMRMTRGQRTLANLVYYLESRLFQGGVIHFFGPVRHWQSSCRPASLLHHHPAQLNSNYSRAMVLTRSNCPKPALALFSRTSDIMDSLFSTEHPALTPCILDAFIENVYETNPKSRAVMVAEAIAAASRTLDPNHPITDLCRILQVSLDIDEEVDHLLWFCDKFCEFFTQRLGKQHKISVYVNLRYFAKLLQMNRFDSAHSHLQNAIEPAFSSPTADLVVPADMEAACLCYLRRKAHLLRAMGDYEEAMDTLRLSVGLVGKLLDKVNTGIAGNPILEETFRMLDEYAHLLHQLKVTLKAIDLHAFALEMCIAVRGENDGKTMRMVAGHAQFCQEAKLFGQEASLKTRFPEIFAEAEAELQHPVTSHKLPCENCGNGQDTQNFCMNHRQLPEMDLDDRMRIRWVKERLNSLS